MTLEQDLTRELKGKISAFLKTKQNPENALKNSSVNIRVTLEFDDGKRTTVQDNFSLNFANKFPAQVYQKLRQGLDNLGTQEGTITSTQVAATVIDRFPKEEIAPKRRIADKRTAKPQADGDIIAEPDEPDVAPAAAAPTYENPVRQSGLIYTDPTPGQSPEPDNPNYEHPYHTPTDSPSDYENPYHTPTDPTYDDDDNYDSLAGGAQHYGSFPAKEDYDEAYDSPNSREAGYEEVDIDQEEKPYHLPKATEARGRKEDVEAPKSKEPIYDRATDPNAHKKPQIFERFRNFFSKSKQDGTDAAKSQRETKEQLKQMKREAEPKHEAKSARKPIEKNDDGDDEPSRPGPK